MLVGTLLLAASVMRPARVSVMLGVVTGCIVMTKINVGVFTAGACVMALLAVAGGHNAPACDRGDWDFRCFRLR